MTIESFKEYVKTSKILDTDEIRQFMDGMSNKARHITFRLNTAYHTPDEEHGSLSELFGYRVPTSLRIFPPLYTDFGKNIFVDENVFINACCHFQDHSGVKIGDDCPTGHNVVFATLNPGLAPEERHITYPASIVLGKNVWIGYNAAILQDITIGDNATIAAGPVRSCEYDCRGNSCQKHQNYLNSNNTIKSILYVLLLYVMLSFGTNCMAQPTTQKSIEMEKKNIGNLLAIYPKPITVIGAEIDGKVNWLALGHTGIIGHDRILVSMSKKHYTNRGIKKSKKLSINLVDRDMLPKADYVGSVSGASVDKSRVFDYHIGANGTPVIDASPVTMECNVVDIYESEGFDNFICSVVNTYAAQDVLDSDGKLDYSRLKPVLFEFPGYSYLATGEVIGRCLRLDREPGMCAKQPMASDGIVRLSKIEVHPEYIDGYTKYATEVGEVSLRTEPGVLTMYAVREKENPCMVTILETYASRAAYESHIASEHFQKYKQGTLHMVKALTLSDQTPLNPTNRINNFIQ